MNEHVLYNVQKSIVEEVKQELLKNTGITLKKLIRKHADRWLENTSLII